VPQPDGTIVASSELDAQNTLKQQPSASASGHAVRGRERTIECEEDGWSAIIGHLLYDITWVLLRSISIFILYWLATHAESKNRQIIYILVSIQILQIDASLKDYWYGSLKKGCICSCRCQQPSGRLYEGRSIVV
jgi:hypothetical protein